jgi:hypothetical protein
VLILTKIINKQLNKRNYLLNTLNANPSVTVYFTIDKQYVGYPVHLLDECQNALYGRKVCGHYSHANGKRTHIFNSVRCSKHTFQTSHCTMYNGIIHL